jgi:cytochrome c
MTKIRYGAILAASLGLLFAQGATASDSGATAAQRANCMGCHQVDQRRVGPTFKDIANKYRDNKDAAALLEKKIRNGGSGNWGRVPMPPTPASVSDADIRSITQWILSLH